MLTLSHGRRGNKSLQYVDSHMVGGETNLSSMLTLSHGRRGNKSKLGVIAGEYL
jgi:hypothetical protein